MSRSVTLIAFAALIGCGGVAVWILDGRPVPLADPPGIVVRTQPDEGPSETPVAEEARIPTRRFTGVDGRTGRALSGRVRDAQGTAVGCARVRARLYRGATTTPATLSIERFLETTEDGRFVWPMDDDLGAATVTLRPALEGYAGPSRAYSLLPGRPAPHDVELVLTRCDRRWLVRVVDPASRPVGGARIEATGLLTTVETDFDGRAEVPSVRRGDGTILRVAHPTHATVRVRLDADERSDEVVVTLTPGATIRGIVTDRRGEKVSGVAVRIRGAPVPSTVTDETGAFLVSGLAPRATPYEVSLSHAGFASTSRTVHVAAPGTTSIDVVLHRGGRIAGRVVDPEDRPLHGATVALRRTPGNGDELGTTTDSEGRFVFLGLTAHRHHLWVAYPELAPHLVELQEADADLVIRLDPGMRLDGIIRDENGQPVPGAQVTAKVEGTDVLHPEIQSGADGRFTFAHLPARLLTLEAVHWGFVPEIRCLVPPWPDTVDLVLHRGSFFSGVVVSAGSRAAIPTFQVAIEPAVARNGGVPAPPTPDSWRTPGRRFETTNGRFRSRNPFLRGGSRYRIEVRASGYEASLIEEWTAPQAGTAESLTVRLAPGCAIQGRIIATGTTRPLSGIRVAVEGADWNATTSGDDGRFVLEGLARSAALLELGGPGVLPITLPLPSLNAGTATELGDLEAQPSGGLAVTVLGAGASPVSDVAVRVLVSDAPPATPAEASVREGVTDAAGRVSFDHLVPGTATVSLIGGPEGLSGLARTESLVAGETTSMVLALDAILGDLEGTLLTTEGPAETVMLELTPIDPPRAEKRKTVSAAGRFEFRGLIPGLYRLEGSFREQARTWRGAVEMTLVAGSNVATLRLTVVP